MKETNRVPLLSFRDVEVKLGGRTIVAGVSFHVDEGEILAIVGPNGAGKTTLLRAALNLVEISRGEISLGGEAVASLPPLARARKAAWLPQTENVSENIPVGEFVALGRYPHLGSFAPEGDADHAAVDRAMAEAQVSQFRERGVLNLSGGERQRVLLARSLAQGSPLLLLDEPTSHLDMGYQLQVMQDLDRFRRTKAGRTVLLSVHDLNIASRFADRILWLKDGRVESIGSPLETITSERIYRVYGVDAEIHRSSGWAYVYPPHQRVESVQPVTATLRVHVICGGGSGGGILHRLVAEGFVVTAGALPLLDSDQETCTALRIPSVVEAPFTDLSEPVRAQHVSLIQKCDVLVVAPLVVGPGNLANLLDALPYVTSHPTFLLGGAPGKDRDFAEGMAGKAYHKLLAAGAVEVTLGDLAGHIRNARIGAPAAIRSPSE